MFNFSSFVRTLYGFAMPGSISQEKFVNDLITPLVTRYKISKGSDDYSLDKSQVSNLLRGKANVPIALRKVLNYCDIQDVAMEGIADFVEDTLVPNAASQAVCELDGMISRDSSVSNQDAYELKALVDKPIEYLAHAFLLALRVDNRSERVQETHPEGNESGVGDKNAIAGKNLILRLRNDSSVEIIVGDLFAYEVRDANGFKNIVVIPVNTAFDTKTDFSAEKDPFPIVSETTVHGQWIKRMLQSGAKLHELDARIEDAIQVQKLAPFGKSITGYGKTNRYPIGSLVPLETRNCTYLLLAISDFGERNVARATPDDLKEAFRKLLEYYNANGQGYKLYMPLMGTGRARSSLSSQESLDLFLSVVDENPQYFYGNIHIIVRESDAARITQMGGAQ